METSAPQSEPQPAGASDRNRATKPKAKKSRAKAKPAPQPTGFGFVITTPDKFRIDQLKCPNDISNPLKRNADLAGGNLSGPPAKKNKGGRPRIHPAKPKSIVRFFKTKTRITASLCADIWSRILDFTTPEFLLQARQTSRLLRVLLQKQSQWKAARRETYGFHHPDPPPGLDEMQYADLLSGLGCQTKGCGEKSARRVYWGFQRRWCSACLRTNTIKVGLTSR